MNDELDVLQRATRALREETAVPERRAGLTRARVLDAAGAKKRPLWRFLVTLVAVLGTSTALARVAFPEEARAIWHEIVAPLRAPEPVKEPAVARKKLARKPVVAPVAPAPAPVPEVIAPVPSIALAPAPKSPLKITRKTDAVPPPESSTPVLSVRPTAEPVESAELMLFRRAERLHRAQDREAIAAWDAYLRVAPSGVLVPEARYNRALALLRAGRHDEAREALAPFAAGDFDGFRAREARALIDQLADAGRD